MFKHIDDYITQVKTNQTTSRTAVAHYLGQIETHKNLRAVMDLNPYASDDAQNIDNRQTKPPLHGLPILIKDNINTADTTITSAGSVALANNQATTDAPLVANLRKAGVVVLGKTNMTEFANYMVDYRDYQGMPNGYSSRGGQCVHPAELNLGHYVNPSGSSTGSAVAVATGQALAAIGTETYGSIISPSQRLGIVGLKPTADSVEMKGVIPISNTLDIAGPMTSCVADAAHILGAMQDKTYTVNPTAAVNLGVYPTDTTSENDYDNSVVATNARLLSQLITAGATRSETVLSKIDEGMVFAIMRYEFRASLNAYLSDYADEGVPADLSAIIAYNKAHPDTALKYGQNNLEASNHVGASGTEHPDYIQAIHQQETAKIALRDYFINNSIDILFMADANCGLAAVTGFPSITVPLGVNEQGLPVGCCLVANRGQEQLLLNVAAAVEALCGV